MPDVLHRLRTATAADIASMQDVELDAGARFRTVGLGLIADDPAPTAAELSPYVRNGAAWVVEKTDAPGRGPVRIVAYAIASIVDDDAHVDQVSVRVEAAGLGLGRALVEQIAAWGDSHGLTALTLTTFRDVPFNGPLYERWGFVALDDADLEPELAAIRHAERDAGLDLSPRIAMRRSIGNRRPTEE